MDMEIEKYCITSKNDMYIFFQLIDMIEPESVLDAGCFLKRIGAVSRNVLDKSIDEEIRLDTVDMYGMDFPVYKTIYNNIFRIDELCAVSQTDLVMMLNVTDIFSLNDFGKIASWSVLHSKYIVADVRTYEVLQNYISTSQINDIKYLNLDDDVYYLVVLKCAN